MKTLKNMFVAACVFTLTLLPVNAADYMASSFGIKSNGTTLNTTAIQAAINYISANGGGRLVFKVGRYLSGSIILKDNVTIDLGEGAILVGSTNPYDYVKVNGTYGFVMSDSATNVGVTGLGVIDGQGTIVAQAFLEQATHGYIKDDLRNGRTSGRPDAVYFFNSKNVTIKGINVNNSANWTLVCDRCDNLLIDKVTINSRAYWNNDGIDIVDCTNTTVQNCFVDSTDDGICLKSHNKDYKCDNVLIHNNTITSSASGIKFGTFGKGGFTNIKVINNVVYDTFRSAVTIQSVDGGIAENIEIDSLKSYNTANPIYLVIGERHGTGSSLKHVRISNVYAEVSAAKPDFGRAFEGPTLEDEPRNTCPCGIVGLPEIPVEDVVIENVEIKFPGGANTDYACVKTNQLDSVPEMPKAYPEFSQFKELPAWGFFIRHADGVVFNNVKLSAAAADYRPCVVLDDVHDSDFKGLSASAPKLKSKLFARNSFAIKK